MRNRLHTDNTPRHCSRCGDSLTDPASRECGVGPICRKKDTHLYAKTIAANFAIATVRALSVRPELLAAEVIDTWADALATLLKAAEKVANITDDDLIIRRTGADLRAVVRACDLVCSYENPGGSQVRSSVIDVVQACGYVGLAGVLSGKASTSPSKTWFEAGRVYMSGLGNKSGWAAMRQIPGIVTPKYRGDRQPYSAPASHATTFLANVRRYWPMYEGDIDTVDNEAATWVETHTVAAEEASSTTGSVYTFGIAIRSNDFVTTFPWVRGVNMGDLLTQLKAIPAHERSYSPATRSWSFALAHLDRVMEIAKSTGWFGEIKTTRTNETTPEGLYGANTVARRTYRQQNTWHSGNYYGNRRR